MRSAYIGIDVAIAKGKHLPIVVSTLDEGRLIPQRLKRLGVVPPRGSGNIAVLDLAWRQSFAAETRRYVVQVCEQLRLIPVTIAIDAPSSPRVGSERRRAAELALDQAGISCFTTPSATDFESIRDKVNRHLAAGGSEDRIPHANQLWMLAGFEIFRELAEVTECLEVFPQATVRVAGSGQRHKSAPGAVHEQLGIASHYTGWPSEHSASPVLEEIAWGTPHDRLDAYLSSWVASLAENDRSAFGRPPADAIWVPRLPASSPRPGPPSESISVSNSTSQSQDPTDSSVNETMVCPACGKHSFKRWPWGWDAHAAHVCSGLRETEPGARKEEFRRRFAGYF